MSSQLVLSVSDSAQGSTLGDLFRWCWLGADGQALEQPASGDRETLRTQVAERALGTQSTWLILPGERVGTRLLEFSEKEKKHLRSLMPYQLEDEVIGDVEDMHFALSPAANGKVTLAYTDKAWLQAVFAELAALGLEVTRCWSAPLTLPMPSAESGEAWVLGMIEAVSASGTTSIRGLICSRSAPPWRCNFYLTHANWNSCPVYICARPLRRS